MNPLTNEFNRSATMESSKFQLPIPKNGIGTSAASREIPNPNHHIKTTGRRLMLTHHWSLKIGVSLMLGCWWLVLSGCPHANAQTYLIDWFTIDGGGGTSTGGV